MTEEPADVLMQMWPKRPQAQITNQPVQLKKQHKLPAAGFSSPV